MTVRRMQQRGGATVTLAQLNEIPLDREIIVDKDSHTFRIGDGVTRYLDLPRYDASLIASDGRIDPNLMPDGWGLRTADSDGPRCVDFAFPGVLTPRVGRMKWRTPAVPTRLVAASMMATVPDGARVSIQIVVNEMPVVQIYSATTPAWQVSGLNIVAGPRSNITADITAVVSGPTSGGANDGTPQDLVAQAWWEYV